jgi:hypothetical protein
VDKIETIKVLDELASGTSILRADHICHLLFLNGYSCGNCGDKMMCSKLYKIIMSISKCDPESVTHVVFTPNSKCLPTTCC